MSQLGACLMPCAHYKTQCPRPGTPAALPV
nr:MAG TPA: hypothetical protein [Caudoviricetes sp.]